MTEKPKVKKKPPHLVHVSEEEWQAALRESELVKRILENARPHEPVADDDSERIPYKLPKD